MKKLYGQISILWLQCLIMIYFPWEYGVNFIRVIENNVKSNILIIQSFNHYISQIWNPRGVLKYEMCINIHLLLTKRIHVILMESSYYDCLNLLGNELPAEYPFACDKNLSIVSEYNLLSHCSYFHRCI